MSDWSYLAFSAIDGLFIKLLSYLEVDFGGPHSSRCLDVELFTILTDLHVGFRSCCTGHLSQHGIHPYIAQRK